MCKCLEIADGIGYSALPGCHLQAVQRCEGHVEVCPVLVHAPGLASLKRGEAFCIAKFELHEEPASVNLHDVFTCECEIVGEEDLVLAAVLGDPYDHLDLLLQGLAVYDSHEALPAVEGIVYFIEHLHVEVLHVHLPVVLPWRPRLAGPLPLVDVVERGVVPESGYNLQVEPCESVHEVLLREECVSHHRFGVIEHLLGETAEDMQVPVDEVELLFHLLGVALRYFLGDLRLVVGTLYGNVTHGRLHMLQVCHGLAADHVSCRFAVFHYRLGGEHAAAWGLESAEHETVVPERVYDAHAKDLESPFGLSCNTGPEVAESGRVPARLADVAGVDGQSLDTDAALEILLRHPEVERHRVHAAFLEVAAIGLLVGRAERAQLREISFLHHNKKN